MSETPRCSFCDAELGPNDDDVSDGAPVCGDCAAELELEQQIHDEETHESYKADL